MPRRLRDRDSAANQNRNPPDAMRRFTDATGRDWEVVAGRESWGALFAIFVPVGRDGAVRQTPLSASSYEDANRELGGLEEPELRDLLRRSEPKTLSG